MKLILIRPKIAYLLHFIWWKEYELLQILLASTSPKDKFLEEEVIAVLEGHFNPKPAVIAECFKFPKKEQLPDETIAEYMVELYCLCNSCNMGVRDLPDMYAQSPRAAGPRTEGIHIRQIMSAHVTSNMHHFRHSKNLLKLTGFCFAYLYNNEYLF